MQTQMEEEHALTALKISFIQNPKRRKEKAFFSSPTTEENNCQNKKEAFERKLTCSAIMPALA